MFAQTQKIYIITHLCVCVYVRESTVCVCGLSGCICVKPLLCVSANTHSDRYSLIHHPCKPKSNEWPQLDVNANTESVDTSLRCKTLPVALLWRSGEVCSAERMNEVKLCRQLSCDVDGVVIMCWYLELTQQYSSDSIKQ